MSVTKIIELLNSIPGLEKRIFELSSQLAESLDLNTSQAEKINELARVLDYVIDHAHYCNDALTGNKWVNEITEVAKKARGR